MVKQMRVYLFEMDSVRTSQRERELACEKLYKELMKGNVVMLSYNQMCSLTMYDLLDIAQEQYTRKPILELIKNNRICVSKFRNQSVMDYFTNSMKKDNEKEKEVVFRFSSLKFLNDFDKTSEVFKIIDAMFHNSYPVENWKDIQTDELSKEQKKILCEYYQVMKQVNDFVAYIKAVDSDKVLTDYIRILTDTIQSHNNGTYWRRELAEEAIVYVNEAIQSAKTLNRSGILEELEKKGSITNGALKLAIAILDLSYNYQVERSIDNITITHDLDNPNEILHLLSEYYNTHDFDLSNVQPKLQKTKRVLHWEGVSEFCKNTENKTENKEERKKALKRILIKKLFVTIALLLLIFALTFFSKIDIDEIGAISVLAIYLLVELVSWLSPSSKIDAFLSIVRLCRYFKTYRAANRGECNYITIIDVKGSTEYLKSFGKKSESDDE